MMVRARLRSSFARAVVSSVLRWTSAPANRYKAIPTRSWFDPYTFSKILADSSKQDTASRHSCCSYSCLPISFPNQNCEQQETIPATIAATCGVSGPYFARWIDSARLREAMACVNILQSPYTRPKSSAVGSVHCGIEVVHTQQRGQFWAAFTRMDCLHQHRLLLLLHDASMEGRE